MIRVIRRWCFVPSLLLVLAACNSTHVAQRDIPAPPSTKPSIAREAAIRHDIYFLDSDDLEGRGIDTEGIKTAENYIRSRFVADGLKPPPGQKSYFQPFSYSSAKGVDPSTVVKAGGKTLKVEDDFIAVSFSGEGNFSGPVVFAGYGITYPEKKYDDYAGLDVKGKVALVMRFEPHTRDGKSRLAESGWSEHASLISKAKNAADHGAVAIALVNPPDHRELDALIPFARQFPGGTSPVPTIQVEQHVVKDLLNQAHAPDLQTLQDKIDESGKPDSMPLKDVTMQGQIKIQRVTRELNNVMAYIPGEGPHADEIVIVGAHYDHLGRGGPGSLAPRSHEIHHGADDNASGTASILELADILSKSPPLPRSILLITFSAEEEGLIGSQYFVSHPLVPLDKVVAMLNLDMVGRLKDNLLYIGGRGTAGTFDAIVQRADGGSGFQLKDFGRGGIGPSDHTSFALKKIPVLFLFTGMHPDYHRPTDTADKINYAGMSRIVDFAVRLIDQLAAMPRESYVSAADQSATHIMGMGGGSRASLGVVPDYASDESLHGVKITGTSPASAAEKAGLKADDVLTRFNDKKIDNIYDLTDALSSAKPGQTVKLTVRRDNKEISIDATLGERKG
jgi:hypothetical protein